MKDKIAPAWLQVRARSWRAMHTGFDDFLTLEVNNLHVDVLTGIYSEETHLPQPLRMTQVPIQG